MTGAIFFVYMSMEFWRYYMFMSCYIIFLLNICLLPYCFSHSFAFGVKWLILSPVLLLVTLWRISYVTLKTNERLFWRRPLVSLSMFLFKPGSKWMEFFMFVMVFTNLFSAAVVQYIYEGNISNSMTGLLLALTAPIPSKINTAHFINTKSSTYDMSSRCMSREWIIAYTVWNFCFIWDYTPKDLLLAPIHLIPCFFKSFTYSYDYFLGARLFCVTIAVWVLTPTKYTAIFPWCLNAAAFQDIMVLSSKKK
eukprot:157032_1